MKIIVIMLLLCSLAGCSLIQMLYMNRQAQEITRLSDDVGRLKKDADGLKVK